jgi:hypothetical protein
MSLNYGTNGNGFLFSRVTLGSIRNFLLRKEEVVGLLNRLEFKVRLLLVFH